MRKTHRSALALQRSATQALAAQQRTLRNYISAHTLSNNASAKQVTACTSFFPKLHLDSTLAEPLYVPQHQRPRLPVLHDISPLVEVVVLGPLPSAFVQPLHDVLRARLRHEMAEAPRKAAVILSSADPDDSLSLQMPWTTRKARLQAVQLGAAKCGMHFV